MGIKTIANLSKKEIDSHYVGVWPKENGKIPIYHAETIHAFNRIVGYARFINSTVGTVLYRGQWKLYDTFLPSGARNNDEAVSEKIFADICNNEECLRFFGLNNEDTFGWKAYNSLIIESVLQHYGAKTYCMDFVDNHWCALWFGLHRLIDNHYYKRDDSGNLYIYLYVAETTGPCIRGVYIGDDTYTVDLRKALPSIFQRPASQHGWIVRNKERNRKGLEERVIGVIEVSVENAKKWLGKGELLSEENFFPSYIIDQGYQVLLSRQYRSGINFSEPAIIPQNTICNYHIADMIYCSNPKRLYKFKKISNIDIKANNLVELFFLLLNAGWDKSTSERPSKWTEENLYVGQSAVTALLVQQLFGGSICVMNFSRKPHYFNKIGDAYIDLTKYELPGCDKKNYYNSSKIEVLNKAALKLRHQNQERLNNLIYNCQTKEF